MANVHRLALLLALAAPLIRADDIAPRPFLPLLTSPLASVFAGGPIKFLLPSPAFVDADCQSIVTLSDDRYPLVMGTTKLKRCAQDQVVTLTLPCSVPSGVTTIAWTCSGLNATAVNRVNLIGGTSDLETFRSEHIGSAAFLEVACQSELADMPRGETQACTHSSRSTASASISIPRRASGRAMSALPTTLAPLSGP